MGEKLNSFYCNPELWTMVAKMKQAEEDCEGERAFFESKIAKAKKAAKESANLEKINSCTKIIKNIYHQECHEWLVTITNNPLDQLQDLAFQINDFEELKTNRINQVNQGNLIFFISKQTLHIVK